MFNRFDEINNFDIYSFQELDFPRENAIGDRDQKIMDGTSVDDCPMENEIHTRSLKNKTQQFQISFQNDMLKEHLAVFRKEFQNFMEFIKKSISEATSQEEDFEELEYFESGNNTTAAQLIKHSSILDRSSEVNQFLKDLEYETNFNDFLNEVASHTSEQMALHLISMAGQIWESYVKIQKQEPNQEELLMLAEDVSKDSNHKIHEFLIFSTKGSQSISLKKKLSNFMKIYCSTVILVITEYFENPYYQERSEQESKDSPKRSLEIDFSLQESENEIYGLAPQKKRKSSF